MLRVMDNGGGMTIQRLHKSLSFGYSLGKGQDSIGKHGNGLKSSTIRLGQVGVAPLPRRGSPEGARGDNGGSPGAATVSGRASMAYPPL